MELSGILDGILSAAGAVTTGGWSGVLGMIFGGLGAWLKGREERKRLEFQALQEEKKREHQLAVMKFEADNALQIQAAQTDREMRVADLGSLAESIKADRATYLTGWGTRVSKFVANLIALGMALVDMVRGLTRPGITVYLVWVVSRMWKDSMAKLAGTLSDAAQQAMALAVVNTIAAQVLFLAGVAVGWWFGSRGQADKAARPAAA